MILTERGRLRPLRGTGSSHRAVNRNGTLDRTFAKCRGATSGIVPANDGSGDLYVAAMTSWTLETDR